jgi:hypothetical protein
LPHEIRGGMAPAKFTGKCFKSKSLYLLQFFLSLFKLVTRLELQFEFPFREGCRRSIKAAGRVRQGMAHEALERLIPVLVHEIICYRFLKVLLYSFDSSTRPAEVNSAAHLFNTSRRFRV